MALGPFNRNNSLLGGLAPKRPALGGTASILAERAAMSRQMADARESMKGVEMLDTDTPLNIFGDEPEDAVVKEVEAPVSTGWKRPAFMSASPAVAPVVIDAVATRVEPTAAQVEGADEDAYAEFRREGMWPDADEDGGVEYIEAEEVDDAPADEEPEPRISWETAEPDAGSDDIMAGHPAADPALMMSPVPREVFPVPTPEFVGDANAMLSEAKGLLEVIETSYYKLALLCDRMVDENVPRLLGYANDAAFFEAEFGWKYRKARYFIAIARTFRDSGIDEDQIRLLGWTKAKEAEGLTGDKLAALVEYANAGANAKDVATEARRLKGRPETISMKREIFTLFDDQSEMVNKAIDLVLPRLGTTNRSQALSAIVTEWSLSSGSTVLDAKQFLRQGLHAYGADALTAALSELGDD